MSEDCCNTLSMDIRMSLMSSGRVSGLDSLSKPAEHQKCGCRRDYNDKLFNGLELVMLVDILVFRFFLKSSALETLGWLGFFFLQASRLLSFPPGKSLCCFVTTQN